MIKQIVGGGLYERRPSILRNEDRRYNMFRYLAVYIPVENIIHFANYENPDERGEYYISDNELLFNENMVQFPHNDFVCGTICMFPKVYTTETYDDVVSYYKELFK